jgi:glutaredoxin
MKAKKLSNYILIIGYRQQLAKAIHKLGISYSIITEKALKSIPLGVDEVIVTPFSEFHSEQGVKKLNLKNTPTHVIAGTEAGVFPAAILRRVYRARRSSKTLLTRCTDKTEMKRYLSKHDIPMAAFVNHKQGLTAEKIIKKLGLPVVVKDRNNSGGRNVVIAKTQQELESLLAPQRLYEQYISAAEGSIESFIQNGKIIFSNATEYHKIKISNIVPAGYAEDELEQIHILNQKVIKSLNIKWGLTHLEYYRDVNGTLFGEVALRPPGGYIMELIKRAYNIDPWDIFVKIELGLAIESLPAKAVQYCGTVLLHPGEGIVKVVHIPDIKQFPTLVKVNVKVKKGDTIKPRHGVGEDVGYCIFTAKNYAKINTDMLKMYEQSPVKII